MKTVKITIEVEVPDDAKCVAVDEGGRISAFRSGIRYVEQNDTISSGFWIGNFYERCRVANWRETITEVKR
jgi:hypothetical protein